MEQTNELHPCPICGHSVEIEKIREGHGADGCYENWRIYCPSCHITLERPADGFYGRDFFPTEKSIIDEWNHKYSPTKDGRLRLFLDSMEMFGIEHRVAFNLRRQPLGCGWTASFIKEGVEVCRHVLRSFDRMTPEDWARVHFTLTEGVKNYETRISMPSEKENE